MQTVILYPNWWSVLFTKKVNVTALIREDSDVYFCPYRTCGYFLLDCGYFMKKSIDKTSGMNYDLTMSSKKKGQKALCFGEQYLLS